VPTCDRPPTAEPGEGERSFNRWVALAAGRYEPLERVEQGDSTFDKREIS